MDARPILGLPALRTPSLVDVPAAVGVPDITPEFPSTDNPSGSGLALYVMGAVPPEMLMVYANGTPV